MVEAMGFVISVKCKSALLRHTIASTTAVLAAVVGVTIAPAPARAVTNPPWSNGWMTDHFILNDGTVSGITRQSALDIFVKYGPAPGYQTNTAWETRFATVTSAWTTEERATVRSWLEAETALAEKAALGDAGAAQVTTGLWRARVAAGVMPGMAALSAASSFVAVAGALSGGYAVGTLINDYVLHIHTNPGPPFTQGSFTGFKWVALCNPSAGTLSKDCDGTSARVAPNIYRGKDHGYMVITPYYTGTGYTSILINSANYGAALGDATAAFGANTSHESAFDGSTVLKPYNYPTEDGFMRVEEMRQFIKQYLQVSVEQKDPNSDVALGSITDHDAGPADATVATKAASELSADEWPTATGFIGNKLDPTIDPNTGKPIGTGTGSGGSCNCGNVDFSPITTLDYGSNFPFGVFTWASDVLGAASGTAGPISFDLSLPGGGTQTVTLGSTAWESTWRPIIFPIIEFFVTLGAIWVLAFRALGIDHGGVDEE